MQITNHLPGTQIKSTEIPLELKQGEIHRAQIKERLSDSEAVLQIKGKDVTVKFENGVPADDRVTVQINEKNDQNVSVKTIATEATKVDVPEQVNDLKMMQSLGVTGKESPQLKQAVQLLLDKGLPLTKEAVAELKVFFEKAPGTLETKLDTVKALGNKNLEVTQTHLRAIHEALHGKPLTEVLTNIAKEIDPNFEFSKSEQLILKSNSETIQTKEPANTSTSVQQDNNPKVSAEQGKELIELLRKNRESIQSEPDLQKAIQRVRDELVRNPKLDPKMASQLEKAASEAEKLQVIGKDRLLEALKTAEVQLANQEQKSTQVQASSAASIEKPQSEKTLHSIVNELKNSILNEPNLQKSLQKVNDLIINNSRFPEDLKKKLSEDIQEVSKLLKQGRITTGKETLTQALNSVESELQVVEVKGTSQDIKISEVVKQLKETAQREPNIQKAVDQVREQVINNPKIDREVAQKVERALTEVRQLNQIGQIEAGRTRLVQALTEAEEILKQVEARQQTNQTRPTEQAASDDVKQVKESVQREPNIQKAVDQVRDQVVNNPKVDREVAKKIERALTEVRQLNQIGQNEAGRTRLVQALSEAEETLRQVEARPQTNQTRPTEQAASDAVKQVKESVQREPNIPKAVDQVRNQVVNNPKVDREVAKKIERALTEVRQLNQIGQTEAGKARLVQALTEAEETLNQVEARQQTNQTRTTEQPASDVVKQVKESVQREPNIQKAVDQVRDQVINNPKVDREVAQKIEKSLTEVRQLNQIGQTEAGRTRLVQALTEAEETLKQVEARQQKNQTRPTEQPASDVLKQAKESVQREPNIQKAVDQVRDQLVNNPKVDREVAQRVERVLTEVRQLNQIGQTEAGRTRLVQALTEAEETLKQVEARQQTNQARPTEQAASDDVKQVKESVQREPNVQKAVDQVREQVVNNPKVDREVAQKVERVLAEVRQLNQIGQTEAGRTRLVQALTEAEETLKQVEARQQTNQTRPTEQAASEVVKQVKESVQREPNIPKAVDQIREQVVNNPKVDREVAQKVERALTEVRQLNQIGQTEAGKARLIQALTEAEETLKQVETRRQPNQTRPSEQTDTRQQTNQARPEQPAQNSQSPSEQQKQSETLKQVRNQIQLEPNLQNVIGKLKEHLAANKSIDPEIVRNIEKMINQANQLDQSGRDRLTKILQQTEQILNQNVAKQPNASQDSTQKAEVQSSLQNRLANLQSIEQIEKKPSELLKEALKTIQNEPNLEKALEQVKKELTSNPNIDLGKLSKVEKALDHAAELQQKGREIAARQQVAGALTDLEKELASTESSAQTQQISQDSATQYDINELLQPLQIQSKDILVTKVSQKLAEATHEFRELKREISRNLDTVQRLVETFKRNAYPQVKPMLEATISKLDNAILKSDMMLFTDMTTEKQLMQASTQLAQAKKHLAKGEHSEAVKIVQDVKSLVDKILFKPSEQKIMHYVNKESLALEEMEPSKKLLSQFNETTQSFVRQEPTARNMFEMVRSLGLNHDNELANSLVFQKGEQSSQQEQQQQHNLKEALLKLTQGEETNGRVAQQAEQALNNLTGQQLLSKSDSNGSMQNMFFNLPMLLGGKPENVQVFVNSKNEGEQVDWENCNLYFLLETKKLGDVGILLNSTDRNLSITIKNDKPGFKEKMQPVAMIAKEKLQEIGYNIHSIHFAKMTVKNQNVEKQNNSDTQSNAKPIRPVFTEKGMDYKI
ncbi:hypothetical protein ACFSO7_01850 [Bacillus sp. CGMCC 1.16607]|uniref:hypothetical protein n=1 Tax=Bacillus sp. CGMCC 1.16607 TaxID=3351842 RepID=UPI0036417308